MKGTPTAIRKFVRILYGLLLGFWTLGIILGLNLCSSKTPVAWVLLVMTLIIGIVLWIFYIQLKRLKITVEE